MGLISDILNGEGGLSVRNKLNAFIKAYNSIITSDTSFNVLRIDASYVKDATPTTLKFLRDDGTWQTIILNLNLEQILANGENTGALYTIEFENPPVLVNATQARVMTVNHTQQLVPSSINIADVATKSFAEGLVVGLLDDRGSYDASTNLFPSTGGSGISGAILKGDLWYISTGGTLGGITVTQGDTIRALVDTPAQTLANWSIIENNFNYVPENTDKKQDSLAVDGTGVKYVTVDAINANVQTKQVIQITSSTAPTVVVTGFRRTFVDITAQASNINLGTNLSGTPQNGDILWFQIKPTSSGYTIATTSAFENKGQTIPTTLTLNKRINIGFTWDSTTSKWGCIAQSIEA